MRKSNKMFKVSYPLPRCGCGNRKYRSLTVVGILCTFTVLVTFKYIKMPQSSTLVRYNARGSWVDHFTARSISTEGLSKNLGKAIVNNVVKYVDNTSELVYPVTTHRRYLIENPNLCSSVSNLDVLVIVHTAPSHFDRRESIRRTWTNETYFKHLGSVRVLFLLGRVNNADTQHKIEQEFNRKADLLQGDFIDAYRNLTLKGVMAYKWISERCRNAKLILKVDDDIAVDTFRLLSEYMPQYKNQTKTILCNRILAGTMLIIRKKKSKWYVDEKLFQGQKFYPRYCSGFFVLITNDVIPDIYKSATVTPFFWVDDVYLYGLAPGRVPGIRYNNLKKGSHQLTAVTAIKCYKNATKTCNYLVTGASQRTDFDNIWTNMNMLYRKRIKTMVAVTTDNPLKTNIDSKEEEKSNVTDDMQSKDIIPDLNV